MAPRGEKLSRRQEQAIAALLAQPTLARAAEAAGVGERTLRVWLTNASFLAAYRAARRTVVEGTIARLQRATGAAYRTLRRNLRCGTPAVEVKAASIILDQANRGLELLDLETRLEAIEESLRQKERERGRGA